MPTFRKIAIVNSDTHTPTEFNLVVERLDHLKHLIQYAPLPSLPQWGEGVEAGAVLGMTCIFESIPPRFPVEAVLHWLRDEINPDLPTSTVESALIQLARIYA